MERGQSRRRQEAESTGRAWGERQVKEERGVSVTPGSGSGSKGPFNQIRKMGGTALRSLGPSL